MKQLEIWPKEPCKRLVVREGKIIEIECKTHSYSWSGRMPCTGVYRCVFCGKPKDQEDEMNLRVGEIWTEMARRKVRFHKDEQWDKIELWGLFNWSGVSRLIENGQLIIHMKKVNRIIWVTPSKAAWETKIKPLIDKYSLEELTRMAGWV